MTQAAEGSNVVASMTTAFDGIKGDALSALGAIAPIALSIAGAFLVWKYGMKFFKGVSK